MIGFVVAMEKELQGILPLVKITKESKLANKKLFVGKLKNFDIAIIECGVGKVNATLATQALIDKFKIDTIFNFGIAGAVNYNFKLGEVYVVENCAQYDFDISEFNKTEHPVGKVDGFEEIYFSNQNGFKDKLKTHCSFANLGTADKFSNKPKNLKVLQNLGLDLCDMEACAIAQTCFFNNVNWVFLKGVSDFVGKKINSNYSKNCEKAMDNFIKIFGNLFN